ncbi:MAG TPA: type IV-A pilus assembly ATPase PilB [Myxococcota bacterium]|nr:type IV-A pilus assembly ATPase PilB [Myxococcota bacterium]HQK50456.1 type IV-A pilus assembly ATPase PilB [Myxococcota bacterium]
MPEDPRDPTKDEASSRTTDRLPSRVGGGGDYTPARVGGPGSSLGELLLREKLINLSQLQDAQRVQQDGENLGYTLAKLGYLEESHLISFLSRQYGVPSINLDEADVSEEAVKLVPREVAERHVLMPIMRQGSTLIVAMSDPGNIYAMDDLKFLTGLNVEVLVASETSIRKAIERYYGTTQHDERLKSLFEEIEGEEEPGRIDVVKDEQVDLTELAKATEEAPVVRLVNMILVDAVKRGASDIHIEAYEKDFRVRYRMDGVLYEVMRPPMRLRNAIVSRIKIMAELDIAERRLPQDGRIRLVMGKEKEVDFRISILPCLFGEKVVARVLDKSALKLDLAAIGFEEVPLRQFREAIHQPWGMVLVTGPTGSGKSTTLYSALTELNTTTENISTAEDPVEMNIPGINQVHVREEIGLTFAAALRSFLRQDPDIIMVGEIRDFETAETAVKAALTGHLVLSTLHTNDAPSTINRLLNMGIEPFLVTASLILVLAQRLVRKICKECKEPAPVSPEVLMQIGFSEKEAKSVVPMKGRGCRVCNETGYKGRSGIYEVMPVGDEIKEAILQGFSAVELKREAMRLGMMSLRQAGLAKVKAGVTTIEEVLRVTRAD